MSEGESTVEQIRRWMLKGGRPLEMQVAAEFDRFAQTVEQSPFYLDADTGKPREIDVVATWTYGQRFTGSVAVACKSKPEPFVVILEQDQPRLLEWRCVSNRARGTLPAAYAHIAAGDELDVTLLFSSEVPVGHSMITKTQKDLAWEAAMSAAKAAHSLATRSDDPHDAESGPWHVSFPLVVTDGVLATARLRGTEIDVAEVNHARFALKWPLDGDTSVVIVDVVQATYLPTFAANCGHAIGLAAKHAFQKEQSI